MNKAWGLGCKKRSRKMTHQTDPAAALTFPSSQFYKHMCVSSLHSELFLGMGSFGIDFDCLLFVPKRPVFQFHFEVINLFSLLWLWSLNLILMFYLRQWSIANQSECCFHFLSEMQRTQFTLDPQTSSPGNSMANLEYSFLIGLMTWWNVNRRARRWVHGKMLAWEIWGL